MVDLREEYSEHIQKMKRDHEKALEDNRLDWRVLLETQKRCIPGEEVASKAAKTPDSQHNTIVIDLHTTTSDEEEHGIQLATQNSEIDG